MLSAAQVMERLKQTKPGDRRMTGNRGFDLDKYPMWVKVIPGILAGSWVIWSFSHLLWTRLSSSSLNAFGKGIVTCLCLSGIAFAISAMWPFKGQEQVRRGDIGDFWSFVRGPAPEVAYRRALWVKMRRTVGIWLLGVLFMVAWMVAGMLGLVRASVR
jgi:hypothetical protein